MRNDKRTIILFLLFLRAISQRPISTGNEIDDGPDQSSTDTRAEKRCIEDGWRNVLLDPGNTQRKLLWKGPDKGWRNGAIVVLHGGGGTASDFCAGGLLIQPQIRFTKMAIERGFAVFVPIPPTIKSPMPRGSRLR